MLLIPAAEEARKNAMRSLRQSKRASKVCSRLHLQPELDKARILNYRLTEMKSMDQLLLFL